MLIYSAAISAPKQRPLNAPCEIEKLVPMATSSWVPALGLGGYPIAEVWRYLRIEPSPDYWTTRVPFMPAKKCAGKVHTYVYSPGSEGAVKVTVTVSPPAAISV